MTPHYDQVIATAGNRLAGWQAAAEAEVQDLLTTASTIRQQINAAKTTTKRSYYEKKFKKTTQQLLTMLAALERIKNQRASVEVEAAATPAPSESVEKSDNAATV